MTKTYDGGTLLGNGTGQDISAVGLQGGDTLDKSSVVYSFNDKNVGTTKIVTASGYDVKDTLSASMLSNYNVAYNTNTSSIINKANLTINTAVVTKTYDGGTLLGNGTGQDISAIGLVGGDTLNKSSVVYSFNDKNAGTTKIVTAAGYGVLDTLSANMLGNYSLTYNTNNASVIAPKTLSLSPVVANRIYNGTTLATISSYGLAGFVGSETVTASSTSASFDTKEVGINKTVTISGISLANGTNGGLATNYSVASSDTSTATIVPAPIVLPMPVQTMSLGSGGLEGNNGSGFVQGPVVTFAGSLGNGSDHPGVFSTQHYDIIYPTPSESHEEGVPDEKATP